MKSTKSQRNNHLPKTTKSHYVICKSLNNVPEDLYGATFQKSPYKVNLNFYKVHFFARCILLHNLRQHLETLSQVCGAPQCGSVPTSNHLKIFSNQILRVLSHLPVSKGFFGHNSTLLIVRTQFWSEGSKRSLKR